MNRMKKLVRVCVNRPFKPIINLHETRFHERQGLGHNETGNVAGRVEPEMRVERAGPGLRTRRPHLRHIFFHSHEPETVGLFKAGEERYIGSQPWFKRSQLAYAEFANMVRKHRFYASFAQYTAAVQLTFVQEHAQKPHIIGRSGIEGMTQPIKFWI